MPNLNIEKVISEFTKNAGPYDRYSSFDYCYNYFHPSNRNILKENMEVSCNMLGFYLASWGMFRGSSYMLSRSAKHFEKSIEYIAQLDPKVWDIDVSSYGSETYDRLEGIYRNLRLHLFGNDSKGLKRSHLTLVTKVMLGVFGTVPAYDDYFCKAMREEFKGQCGFRSFNHKSLGYIKVFYDQNQNEIDQLSAKIHTKDFLTGADTNLVYPRAKIVDMYGFIKGLGMPIK